MRPTPPRWRPSRAVPAAGARPQPQPRKYAYIDALRGVAILLVLTDHVGLAVRGEHTALAHLAALGQTGVQLFFVVSALTLSLSAESRGLRTFADIRDFWLRRLFRIAPLYWFGILLYALGGLVINGVWSLTADRALANLFLIHGFVPDANDVVVPGGWSIGTEMAFYFLFPLLWQGIHTLRLAWLFFAAALALSLAVALVVTWPDGRVENNSFLYFNLVTQMPVFALGMVAFHRLRRGPLPSGRRLLAGAFGLVCLAGVFWESGWRLAFSLAPVAFGGAFLALTLAATRYRGWWVNLLGIVGRVSYAVYVTHALIVWQLAAALKHLPFPIPNPSLAFVAVWIAAATLSLLAAALLHASIERPGIRLGAALVKRLRQRPAAT